MKNRFNFILTIILCLSIASCFAITAFAREGLFTLSASPVKVLVNGEEFHPKDVNGKDALVFTSDGTTYAPLRALAEAYGLEVSYDSSANTAIVEDNSFNSNSEIPFRDSIWTVKEKPVTNYGNERIFTAKYNGPLSLSEFKTWWKTLDISAFSLEAENLAEKVQHSDPASKVTMYFSYGKYPLGTAYAFGSFTQSNFDKASEWIG